MKQTDIEAPPGPLKQFSLGLVSKEGTVEPIRLRDYSELLMAHGSAGLPLPIPSETEINA